MTSYSNDFVVAGFCVEYELKATEEDGESVVLYASGAEIDHGAIAA